MAGRPMKIGSPDDEWGHFIFMSDLVDGYVLTWCEQLVQTDESDPVFTPHLHALRETCEGCYQAFVKHNDGQIPY